MGPYMIYLHEQKHRQWPQKDTTQTTTSNTHLQEKNIKKKKKKTVINRKNELHTSTPPNPQKQNTPCHKNENPDRKPMSQMLSWPPWSWIYTWGPLESPGWGPCGAAQDCWSVVGHHHRCSPRDGHSSCTWSWSSSFGAPSNWWSQRRAWSCLPSRIWIWFRQFGRKREYPCCQPQNSNLEDTEQGCSDWS